MGRKIREKRTTILVVVEGETERAFCLHLKSRLSRNVGAQITVECAHGGGPIQTLRSTENYSRYADFDYQIAFFDGDIPLCEQCIKIINERKIKCLISNPCFEGWMLTVFGYQAPRSSTECKKLFHEKLIREKQKTDQASYHHHISDEMLKLNESSDLILQKIIAIFSNDMNSFSQLEKQEGGQ